MAACRRACALPEIVQHIAEQLSDDLPALTRLCLVNSVWYDAARRPLWRKPPIEIFFFQTDAERRKLHSASVQCLDLTLPTFPVPGASPADALQCWASLIFPSLKKIVIGPWDADAREQIRQHLSPGIEEIEIVWSANNNPITEWMLADLRLCRSLKKLTLRQCHQILRPEAVVDFLRSFEHLESVVLVSHDTHSAWDKSAIEYLDACGQITSLAIVQPWNEVLGILAHPEALKTKKRIEVIIESSTLPLICPRLVSLTHFKARVDKNAVSSEDTLENGLKALSANDNLKHLQLYLDGWDSGQIQGDWWLPFQKLCHLETFELSSHWTGIPTLTDFEHAMPQVIPNWTLLRVLRLNYPMQLTPDHLACIGDSCQRLEELWLQVWLKREHLEPFTKRPEALFPRLKGLDICGMSKSEAGVFGLEQAHALLHVAPKLQKFVTLDTRIMGVTPEMGLSGGMGDPFYAEVQRLMTMRSSEGDMVQVTAGLENIDL